MPCNCYKRAKNCTLGRYNMDIFICADALKRKNIYKHGKIIVFLLCNQDEGTLQNQHLPPEFLLFSESTLHPFLLLQK